MTWWRRARRSPLDLSPAYLRPQRRRRLVAVGFWVTTAFIVTVVLVLVPRYVLSWDLAGDAAPADRAEAINNVRTSLLQGLAGLALLIGAVFTWRQLQLTRQGQVAERFTAAVTHLGDASIDVRIGGVHALEVLAAVASTDRDAVMDVLSAFVRRQNGLPAADRTGWSTRAPTPGEPLRVRAPDVDAALRALARRVPRRGEVLHLDRIAVARARLEFARLDWADLHFSDLSSADLIEANLRGADLTGSNLIHARLTGAALVDADLRDILAYELVAEAADLRGADLTGADLTNARLNRARLNRADLRGTDLTGADLTGANLRQAIYDDTTTWPADLDWQAAGAISATVDTPPRRPTSWLTRPP
jgi:hypothetical protein